MKVNINQTFEITDEQRTINGELLKLRQVKRLVVSAIFDLIRGQRVALADYGFDDRLEELLATPEARQRALEYLARYSTSDAARSVLGELDVEVAPAVEEEVKEGCVRCELVPEVGEVGRCEDCGGFLHMACRADEMAEVVEERGPLPLAIRGGTDPGTGEKVPAPYLCGLCMINRLELESSV